MYKEYYTAVSSLVCEGVYICGNLAETLCTALCSFEDYIQCVQKSIVTDFHERQSEFVKEKMKIVPSVLNLCKVKTPTALINILSLGTKAVPHGQLSDYDNFLVMDQDLRNVITRCFFKIVGFWPTSNLISSVHQFFIEIISQCPCNHIFISFMYTLMSSYYEYYELFKPSMLGHKSLKTSMIPEGCVLTVSDKGLGPVLLPYQWFVCEYSHQAVLGGHVPVLSSEGSLLFNIIADFRRSLSILENLLFKSIFKYSGNNFKLAALKIVPKIHKLSHPITCNSVKLLPSHPIRGGELCPFNQYSVTLCQLLQHLHNDVKNKLLSQPNSTSTGVGA